jgi:PKD repeat protein
LTYLWDFGNGTSQSTSTATVTYTYPANGRYTATLQVRDSLGALSDPVTLTIDTLNNAPVPVITLPTNGATFAVGDTITLSGSATDAQDGPLANANLSWSVLLHHRAGQVGAHTHPLFGPQTGNNLTFVAPAPEDLDAASNSYLEIRLTATDSAGAAVTISRDLLPAKVALTVRTSPNGLKITANGTQYSDGDVITSWRNYSLTLAGLPQRASDGRWLALSTWEDNSTNTNRSILTPTSPQTYTATFGKNAKLMFMPFIRQP